jgi:hypothetical protein
MARLAYIFATQVGQLSQLYMQTTEPLCTCIGTVLLSSWGETAYVVQALACALSAIHLRSARQNGRIFTIIQRRISVALIHTEGRQSILNSLHIVHGALF